MNFVHDSVKIPETSTVGYFSVIEENVSIGANVVIGNNVTVHEGTVIGDGTIVSDGTILGKLPKTAKTSTLKLSTNLSPLSIGEEVTVGANTVIYRGANIGSQSFIADLATIREEVEIQDQVIIGRGVTVENHCFIGNKTKIQTNSYITAHTTLEERVFIAPCVTTTNDNYMGRTEERFDKISGAIIKKGARVGGASIILPGVTVAEESFIAAGALVTKDTEPKMMTKGIPAKSFKEVPERELLT